MEEWAVFFFENAEDLDAGAEWIEEGAEEVEDGAMARGGQFFADRCDSFESGMPLRGEEESEVSGAELCFDLVGREVYAKAERFEHVCASGGFCDGAVAMFGNGEAGGDEDESGGSRDVEEGECSTACAARVEKRRRIGLKSQKACWWRRG